MNKVNQEPGDTLACPQCETPNQFGEICCGDYDDDCDGQAMNPFMANHPAISLNAE